MAVDAKRVIADLRELDEKTGGEGGARRLCWTDEWRAARELLRKRLRKIEGVQIEEDEAGNLWARLEGKRPETVALGSHLDSVPERRLARRGARRDGGRRGAAGGRRARP